jgi:hypothetical protein
MEIVTTRHSPCTSQMAWFCFACCNERPPLWSLGRAWWDDAQQAHQSMQCGGDRRCAACDDANSIHHDGATTACHVWLRDGDWRRHAIKILLNIYIISSQEPTTCIELSPYFGNNNSWDQLFPKFVGTFGSPVSAFRDRGGPKADEWVCCVPQPRWVERVGEREGGRGEVVGVERERGGSPAAFVFVLRPGRVRL